MSFGEVTVVAKNVDLLWDTVAKFGYKQKYVIPFRNLLKRIMNVPELKEAAKNAPSSIQIKTAVTNNNPGVFTIGVSGKESTIKYPILVNPRGIANVDNSEDIINGIGINLADQIKALEAVVS